MATGWDARLLAGTRTLRTIAAVAAGAGVIYVLGAPPSGPYALISILAIAAAYLVGWLVGQSKSPKGSADPVSDVSSTDKTETSSERMPKGWISLDALRNAIRSDIANGVDAGVLATIKWTDFERIARFDPHAAERFLLHFQNRLRSIVAKDRLIACCDHDCFALWLPADPEEVGGELRALKYALEAELPTPEGALIPEVHLFGAFFPDDANEADALLVRARITRLTFEEKGRTFRVLREPPSRDLSNDFALGQHLRRAIERNEFELFYQPIINAATQDLLGAEALLRWTSRDLGKIPPSRFVPVVERVGLADEVGAWVLNHACKQAAAWRRSGFSELKVAINVSHRQLANLQLERIVEGMLSRYSLPPSAIELELTESAATRDIERTRAFFARMNELGVRLAIDDFGTGFSSLSYLKRLRFEKLKIDREFVSDVDKSLDSQAICKSLVALACGLEIDVLAEGVETRAEVEFLLSIGCPLFQGYYFSKPLSSNEFLDYICSADWIDKLAPEMPASVYFKKRLA